MRVRLYQVDAFTEHLFGGNPAAVCPLETWLAGEAMQAIAAENNLAETAFYVREAGGHAIRWFTPASEVDLCGHATLAAAWVVFNEDRHAGDRIDFASRSGVLHVRREGSLLTLDFPVDRLAEIPLTPAFADALGRPPVAAFKGRTDYMLVYGAEDEVAALAPDMVKIAAFPARGLIVTAPGRDVDFVSRFFAPQVGIAEDPVTGSAHTSLTPYWAQRLGKPELDAVQLSRRRGTLRCRMAGDRVEIAGHAVPYLSGFITLP